LAPVLGGVIAQHFSWRWVFVLNVPIAVLVIFIALRWIRESRYEDAGRHIDFGGAALATLGLGALVYALISLQSGLQQTMEIAIGVGGVIVLGLFVLYEKRTHSPMMPLKFFSYSGFAGANAYRFLLYAGLGGSLFFVPFDLINVHHYTPTQASAAMLPMTLIIFFFSRFSGALQARLGAGPMLAGGAIVAALGFVLFALAAKDEVIGYRFFRLRWSWGSARRSSPPR
jgi:MFS family permease